MEQGDVNDHVSLVKAIKQVDVVISAVGSLQILDQTKIIAAIKEVGHIKVHHLLFTHLCLLNDNENIVLSLVNRFAQFGTDCLDI